MTIVQKQLKSRDVENQVESALASSDPGVLPVCLLDVNITYLFILVLETSMLLDVKGPRFQLCRPDTNIQVVLQIDFVYTEVCYFNHILTPRIKSY